MQTTSENANPEQVPGDLCQHCQNITIENLRKGYEHAQRTQWCRLCDLLDSFAQMHTLRLEEPILPGFPPILGKSIKHKWKPIFVMTRKGDPAEKFGVPAITSPLPETRSEESFTFIKHCLQECLMNHNCSLSMFSQRDVVRRSHLGRTLGRRTYVNSVPNLSVPEPMVEIRMSPRLGIKRRLREYLAKHNRFLRMFRPCPIDIGPPITVNSSDSPDLPDSHYAGFETLGFTVGNREPLRLIDVRAFCGDHNHDSECGHNVRLVENLPVSPKYMTLSHCWGKRLDTDAVTTTGNLPSRMKEIRLDDLPANFWDAISITRRLGIRYLWIDALCIIQDSQDDWAQESVKMGHIYDGSYLTIAASASEDSNGGCYRGAGIRQDSLGGGTLVEITNKLGGISRETSTLILWAPNVSDDDPLREPAPLVGCPLSQRGWVFQERILSPRTIHFTNSQLVWECREVYEMEDRLPFVTPHGTLSLATDREISPDWIKRIWYNWLIGFGYSSRKFTMMEDRLIAIAGIARSLHERTGVPYIAGLWTKNLGFGLGWLETPNDGTEDPSRLSNKPYTRRRPTWTWASSDQEFQYSLDDFIEDRDLHYVDSRIKSLGDVDDPFTIITGGWLKIRGRVYRGSDSYFTELHLDMSQEVVPFAAERSQLESSVFNWNGALSQLYYIRLGQFSARPTYRTVVVRESWLIVRRVEAEEEEEKEYERLGIAYRTHTSSLEERGGPDTTEEYRRLSIAYPVPTKRPESEWYWVEEKGKKKLTPAFRIMDLKLV